MLLCFTTKIARGFVPNLRERDIHSTTPAARAKLGSVKAALRTHSMDLGTTQADFEAPLVHGQLSPPINTVLIYHSGVIVLIIQVSLGSLPPSPSSLPYMN